MWFEKGCSKERLKAYQVVLTLVTLFIVTLPPPLANGRPMGTLSGKYLGGREENTPGTIFICMSTIV